MLDLMTCSTFLCETIYINLPFTIQHSGVGFAHNAPFLVNEYRTKLRKIFDMWVDNKEGVAITLNELKDIYGEQAYAYNNEVVV